MNDVDIALCELRLVEKEGGGWRPAHHVSTRSIYDAVGRFEEFYNIEENSLMCRWYYREGSDVFRFSPRKRVSKQDVFNFVLKMQAELHLQYEEHLQQEEYELQHGTMNGYKGKWTCNTCGGSLEGEAKTVQFAYACGDGGRQLHHLHVGILHFCNLDCFETYRSRYWAGKKASPIVEPKRFPVEPETDSQEHSRGMTVFPNMEGFEET